MSTASEIYFAACRAAAAQYEIDKAAAETKRQATLSLLWNSTEVGSVFYEGSTVLAVPGFPLGMDADGAATAYANFAAAIAGAQATKVNDLFLAEQRRQGAISIAADNLRTLGELP